MQQKKLCARFSLEKLTRSIEGSNLGDLQVFFSAKTHKYDCPLRVIVSEKQSWQEHIARFLQDKLKCLVIEDPFLIRNSEVVVECLNRQDKTMFTAISVDVKFVLFLATI